MGNKALPTGAGFIDPNFPNPNGPDDANIIIYGYTPNVTICILGIVLFTLAFLFHLVQVWIYRFWPFIPFIIACLMEVTGYIFRTLSSRNDPYRVTYFVVQYFMLVTAPVLISASIYVCLTRIITWAESQGVEFGRNLLLRRVVLLWTFITIDVVCLIIQVTGAAMIGSKTSDGKDPKVPNDVLLSGLAIQSLAFLAFLVLLTIVAVKICQNRQVIQMLRTSRSPFIGVLAVVSLLVFVRTLFRLSETSQGVFGHLSSHEGFFAGLEFAPVIVAVMLLAVWHPGRWPTAGRAKNESI